MKERNKIIYIFKVLTDIVTFSIDVLKSVSCIFILMKYGQKLNRNLVKNTENDKKFISSLNENQIFN